MPKKERRKVILDTDTGVDDALAIALALRSDELEVKAITAVSGNVHVDLCLKNILLTLEVLDIDVKEPPIVAKGEAAPLIKPLFVASEVHGWDGLGGITKWLDPKGNRRYPEPKGKISSLHAVDLILDLIAKYPDELTLIAVGPLTNVAKAIIKNKDRMRKLKEIVVMGGAFRVYGNTTLHTEFNIFVDPHAAQIVFDLGIPLTIVPLDVTEQVILKRSNLIKVKRRSKLFEFIRDITKFYMDYQKSYNGIAGCFMHDPLAVGVAIDPSLVKTLLRRVDVETAGDFTIGMTLADLREGKISPEKSNAKVCVDVDSKRFLDMFTSRLLTP